MTEPQPLPAELLALLRCPGCKGHLRTIMGEHPMLECPACRLRFDIRDGIPVMLLDEASKF